MILLFHFTTFSKNQFLDQLVMDKDKFVKEASNKEIFGRIQCKFCREMLIKGIRIKYNALHEFKIFWSSLKSGFEADTHQRYIQL